MSSKDEFETFKKECESMKDGLERSTVEENGKYKAIPVDFEIREILTDAGAFRKTDVYRDGERLIAWCPNTEDASTIMPVSKFLKLAELIPEAMNTLGVEPAMTDDEI